MLSPQTAQNYPTNCPGPRQSFKAIKPAAISECRKKTCSKRMISKAPLTRELSAASASFPPNLCALFKYSMSVASPVASIQVTPLKSRSSVGVFCDTLLLRNARNSGEVFRSIAPVTNTTGTESSIRSVICILLDESIVPCEEIQIFDISLFRRSFNADKALPMHSEALRSELVDRRIDA